MSLRSSGTHPINIEQDVVLARQLARKLATECGMRLIDLTKMVTAVSELARKTGDDRRLDLRQRPWAGPDRGETVGG